MVALLFLSDLCQKGVQKHGQVFGCKVEPTCRNGMSHSKIQFQIQRRDGSRQTTVARHLLFFQLDTSGDVGLQHAIVLAFHRTLV